MFKQVVVSVAVITLVIATAACGMLAPDTAGPGGVKPTAFESWAVGNGTGSFLRPVGPAGGTGVRHGWPE